MGFRIEDKLTFEVEKKTRWGEMGSGFSNKEQNEFCGREENGLGRKWVHPTC